VPGLIEQMTIFLPATGYTRAKNKMFTFRIIPSNQPQ